MVHSDVIAAMKTHFTVDARIIKKKEFSSGVYCHELTLLPPVCHERRGSVRVRIGTDLFASGDITDTRDYNN
jgi:hypothetical protein